MTVRRLTPADWQLLRDLRLTSLDDAPDAFASTYSREAAFDEAEWRRRAAGVWFVAVRKGVPVGIVAAIAGDDAPAGRRDLVAMWVAPQARGSGAAAELVAAVVDWARADGATQVTLGVFEANARARALYTRCGFTDTGGFFTPERFPDRRLAIYRREVHALSPSEPTAEA